MKKLFVWDFHGTLEKGNEYAVIDRSNFILAKCGYTERFSEKDVQRLYGKKWYEYFQDLLPHLPHEKHIELQQKCFGMDDEKIGWDFIEKYIKPTEHAVGVLRQIHLNGHDQIVLSNTQEWALIKFVETVGLTSYLPAHKQFAAHNHEPGIGTLKETLLTNYLKDNPTYSVIIIGDTESDMNLKRVAGGITYLYHHPGRTCPLIAVDYVISDLREVLREI